MSALDDLAKSRQRTARSLVEADQRRQRNVAALAEGSRLRGFEELLLHLDAWQAVLADGPSTAQRLAPLVERAIADFETGLEATLTGYVAVASDAMRDVMEIENLLLDFAKDPSLVDRWLLADRKTIRRDFSPAAVRKRVHAGQKAQPDQRIEAVDYAAHSEALHVGPGRHPIASKGLGNEDEFRGDAGFWEMFAHARRLIDAMEALWLSVGDGPVHRSIDDLMDFRSAWERTQEMQAIWLALVEASESIADGTEDDE